MLSLLRFIYLSRQRVQLPAPRAVHPSLPSLLDLQSTPAALCRRHGIIVHSPACPRRAFSLIASSATWEAAGVNSSHLTVTGPVRPPAPTNISCITSSPTQQLLPQSSIPRSHSSHALFCRTPPLVVVLLPVFVLPQDPSLRQLLLISASSQAILSTPLQPHFDFTCQHSFNT